MFSLYRLANIIAMAYGAWDIPIAALDVTQMATLSITTVQWSGTFARWSIMLYAGWMLDG